MPLSSSPRIDRDEIIELLRAKTAHDFRLYKPGTLRRRIERRMAMVPIETGGMDRYLDILRKNPDQLEVLAKDLLIHVTSFFRDPKVFGVLADKVIPDLIHHHNSDQPLRMWIAGCSTGEETYSLVMLLQEQIEAANRRIKLQVFASDIDADAVATAREGLYPQTIEAEVSPERLARFFTKDDRGYRVSPDMRATVVFTVQDVLADLMEYGTSDRMQVLLNNRTNARNRMAQDSVIDPVTGEAVCRVNESGAIGQQTRNTWASYYAGENNQALDQLAAAQIEATAHGGERMPPKTTFFHPKPKTGLVFRSLG